MHINRFTKHPWTMYTTLENMLHRCPQWQDIEKTHSGLYTLTYNGLYITFHAGKGYGTIAIVDQCGSVTPTIVYISKDLKLFMDTSMYFAREVAKQSLNDNGPIKDYPSYFVSWIGWTASQKIIDTY